MLLDIPQCRHSKGLSPEECQRGQSRAKIEGLDSADILPHADAECKDVIQVQLLNILQRKKKELQKRIPMQKRGQDMAPGPGGF